MREPTPAAYFFGRRSVCVTLWTVAGLLTLAWLPAGSQVPWILPLLAALTALSSQKAYREVETFKAWQYSWNELAGVPQAQPQRPTADLRKQYGPFVIWLLAFVLMGATHSPLTPAALDSPEGVVFVAASLWVALPVLWKAARRPLPRRTTSVAAKTRATRKTHVVRLCLRVPRESPQLEEMVSDLPGYCRALLVTPEAKE
jgi:hypothetical protein